MRSPTSWGSLLSPGDAEDFFSRTTFSPFDPTATDYSATNALWLAELSRLVYRLDREEADPPPTPTRSEFLASAGLNQRAFFQSTKRDTQAMLVESRTGPAYAILVFRGTEKKLQDWITNLEMGGDALVGDDYGVHRGFERAFDPVWPEIESALDLLTCPVFYTGHSLGGALATLAAAKRRPHALYTFGSPRVGNEKFAEGLAGVPIFRVVDDWDVVASVPPESFGFRHVGDLIKLEEASARFSFNLATLLKLVFSPAKPLADHTPVNYVDRLGEMLNAN